MIEWMEMTCLLYFKLFSENFPLYIFKKNPFPYSKLPLCQIMRHARTNGIWCHLMETHQHIFSFLFFICTFLKIKLESACFHPCWVYAHITRFHWGLQNLHWKPSNVKTNILCLDVAKLNMQKCKISELWWRGRLQSVT